MIHHIAVVTPPNKQRYAEMYQRIELPKVKLANTCELERFYRTEQLSART